MSLTRLEVNPHTQYSLYVTPTYLHTYAGPRTTTHVPIYPKLLPCIINITTHLQQHPLPSMSDPKKALVVFGSGPGIGRNIAAIFAQQGFSKIILLSRDKARLSSDVKFVQAAAAEDHEVKTSVDGLPIDLSDTAKVRETLTNLDMLLARYRLEAVLYNAARVGASKMFEFSAVEMETDYRISVVGLYMVAGWALPQFEKLAAKDPDSKPTLLVTSGGLHKDPFPAFFSLANVKSAQYNLVHSLYKQYTPKNVHVAAIVVEGQVRDDAKVTTARHIAEEAWRLYEQPQGEGDLDVEIQDPDYLEFIGKNG
ncbi:hypothetical protein AC578_5471 [Pseudocercospora eumusae]|uniref:Ketoreductase (KR) domain-containing protein n=1 Tax=Pseudocercospora eumusae TaxID=321146 RepID=A0A139GTK0_9PEZI|nr:hypothetical protein AC578_5471 [Pseudocercospora eumusae]